MSYWAQKAPNYEQGYLKARGPPKVDDTPAGPLLPLGPLIKTLQKDDINDAAQDFTESAKIRDCGTIASYNWLNKKGPDATIIVPGKPPLWTPLSDSTQLREDSGKYFRDKNAARFPKHPMEPAVITCLSEAPHLSAEADVFACGSTINSLLCFVRGHDVTFRMLVEKVQNTVFFIRRENSPTELIPGIRGYGHAFPEAYTTWGPVVKGSASHQRILRYSFGGLRFLVRSEVDGYLNDNTSGSNARHPRDKSGGRSYVATSKRQQPSSFLASEVSEKTPSLDILTEMLSDSNVGLQPSTSTYKVQIKAGGSAVDQQLVFDLKTRSIRAQDKDHLADQLPRLWARQIPNFILAFHTRGMFKEADIHVKSVREDINRWERDHNLDLARFAALIHRLIEIVSTVPSSKLELSHQTIGRLDVREQLSDAGDVLSPEVRATWEKVTLEGHSFADSAGQSTDEKKSLQWDNTADKDFTACSVSCGYCGDCTY